MCNIEIRVRDLGMEPEKIVQSLQGTQAVLVEQVRFLKSKKDFLTQHQFYTTPESSLFFLKELPTTQILKREYFQRFAIMDGVSIDIGRSKFDFQKDLWISPKPDDLEKTSWCINETVINEDFISLRRYL